MNRFISVLITLPLLVVMAACTSPKQRLNNQDGPTMLDIYRTHMDGLKDTDKATRLSLSESAERLGQPAFLHTSAREIDARFARLPNPDLVMYVTPHLTASRSPVPGYTTVFPMYETVEYALPGEVRTVPVTRTRTTTAASLPQSMPSSLPASVSASLPTTTPVSNRVGERGVDNSVSRIESAVIATNRSE